MINYMRLFSLLFFFLLSVACFAQSEKEMVRKIAFLYQDGKIEEACQLSKDGIAKYPSNASFEKLSNLCCNTMAQEGRNNEKRITTKEKNQEENEDPEEEVILKDSELFKLSITKRDEFCKMKNLINNLERIKAYLNVNFPKKEDDLYILTCSSNLIGLFEENNIDCKELETRFKDYCP